MHIEFKVEGGLAYFPGLSKPRTIDIADLHTDEAAELRHLVAAARFFQQPTARHTLPKGAADYQQYTITVEDAGRRRTIHLADPIPDANLQALVDYLRTRTAPPNDDAPADAERTR